MKIDAENATLKNIKVDQIHRNPDNPRIIFRPTELDQLQDSIGEHGVQVPISVYREGRHYVLIDGERRWRCCLKLNKRFIPALVQAKPDALTNLLLMFNIHALREQWDLWTIAMKLPAVYDQLTKTLERRPLEKEVAQKTGLKPAVIRRCKLLLQLPQHYKDMLLRELKKPKAEQVFTEDFFIEMERALRTVESRMPDLLKDKDKVRNVLIDKFREGTIDNRVEFRKIPKIARSIEHEIPEEIARRKLVQLFSPNKVSIQDAFQGPIAAAYEDRDVLNKVEALLVHLQGLSAQEIDTTLRERLVELNRKVAELLGVQK